MTRDELRKSLVRRRDDLAELGGHVDGVKTFDLVITLLDRLWHAEDESQVSLAEASRISGYSADHLRRLVRGERIQVTRRGKRLFFRAADLPRKPAVVDCPPSGGYDVVADARQVATRRI